MNTNILSNLNRQVELDYKKLKREMVQANSFGLGPKFLLEKKRNSMDPRESKATKLEMMP